MGCDCGGEGEGRWGLPSDGGSAPPSEDIFGAGRPRPMRGVQPRGRGLPVWALVALAVGAWLLLRRRS